MPSSAYATSPSSSLVLEPPKKLSGEGAALCGRGGGIRSCRAHLFRKSLLRGDFLSLLCDLAQGIPLLNCFSVNSGRLCSPADQYPPSECNHLAVEMVSPILGKPLPKLSVKPE